MAEAQPARPVLPASGREADGSGVCLNSSWQFLPASLIGVGIDVVDDSLLAWSAPRVGRISTFAFANAADLEAATLDRVALTAWFIDQGFHPDQAATATCELLSRLGSSGWKRGMFGG